MSKDRDFEATENVHSNDENTGIDEILKHVNGQIRQIARKNLPHSIIHEDIKDLETDDLAQRALIKLWQAMQKETITHHLAYARRIIYSDAIDMFRRYRPTSQLPLNEYGELAHGRLLFASSETMGDPASLLEQQDMLMRYASNIVEDVLKLPPEQRHAMICGLKEEIADLLPLMEVFLERGVDITKINWAQDKKKLHSQRVSLAIARKKMRAVKQRYL